MAKTSWETAAKWYDAIVSKKGHYYHQAVIMPKLKKRIKKSVLDLACGGGVLAGHVKADYVGLDLAKSLVRAAQSKHPNAIFYTKDVTKAFDLKRTFAFVTCVLALQNIQEPQAVLENAHKHLEKDGQLILVLNHPCFRIPRQSHWGIDTQKKLQYRRIERYMSPLKIPIQVGKTTLPSFHHPLSFYFQLLKECGFVVLEVEEWCSDKTSTGSAAKMENRARQEFPLFLTIIAQKC